MGDDKDEIMFRNISADDEDQMPIAVESLCISCEQQGVTRLLFTIIPYFKEIILSSFECPHCGMKNNEVQLAGDIQDQGLRIELKVAAKDLNRQVVKSESACVKIPELDFEIPAFSQHAELSTIEGILDRAITALKQDQPVRRTDHPATADKIDNFVAQLEKYKNGESAFTFVLDDISGNSFVENPFAPNRDESMTITKYDRTQEQDQKLGMYESTEKNEAPKENAEPNENTPEDLDFTQEVLGFPTTCSNCQSPATTNMKAVDIPFFKQVILMAISCTYCGSRSSEVKPGAGIEDKGTKITLKMTDATDLNRDVLKSDTCTLGVPELEFELQSGTLGGRFTTLEGLFVNIKESIQQQCPFSFGDAPSLHSGGSGNLKDFLSSLEKVIKGESLGMHVVLDDPAGNSYLQNVYAPDEDPNMTIEHYERTAEQNEELGLSDMIIEEHKAAKRNDEAV